MHATDIFIFEALQICVSLSFLISITLLLIAFFNLNCIPRSLSKSVREFLRTPLFFLEIRKSLPELLRKLQQKEGAISEKIVTPHFYHTSIAVYFGKINK